MKSISKPWLLAAIVWIGVIFFSSTALAKARADQVYELVTGNTPVPQADPGLAYLFTDKGFHVSLFCVFGLLLSEALRAFPRRYLLVILAGAVVGSCSEILQSFFPGRDPAVTDVCINIAGTALGVLLYSRFRLKRSPISAASTNLRVPTKTGDDGR